jgi:N-acetylmuramic acid 6-phosphate etherase
MAIDAASIPEALAIINAEDATVAEIVRGEIPHIARAVEIIEAALRAGGRLFYVGAGTSGRLGVLDAAECPPTYGTDPSMIQGVIAGGERALVRAVEGAEDRGEEAVAALAERDVGARDVVVGIAASRRTPFVIAALTEARRRGARTIYLACTPRCEITIPVDVAICPVVGPEVVMGSTRMKAGTAQKMVLNMLSTVTMIRLGKVYENMMVDLMGTSAKLRERAKRVVMIVTGVEYDLAARTLAEAGGHVKTAIVMIRAGVDAETARARLAAANGFVRRAIEGAR